MAGCFPPQFVNAIALRLEVNAFRVSLLHLKAVQCYFVCNGNKAVMDLKNNTPTVFVPMNSWQVLIVVSMLFSSLNKGAKFNLQSYERGTKQVLLDLPVL